MKIHRNVLNDTSVIGLSNQDWETTQKKMFTFQQKITKGGTKEREKGRREKREYISSYLCEKSINYHAKYLFESNQASCH